MKRAEERLRDDFVQLVQTGLLMLTPTTGPDAAQRLRLLRVAQQTPPGQLPANLVLAAGQLIAALDTGELPPWAINAVDSEVHWWPPEYGELDAVPACAPVVDPLRYAGWRLTRDAALATCPRCMVVAAGRANSERGRARAKA